MQTRSKSGIYKPKVYLATASNQKLYAESTSVKIALTLPESCAAMDAEFSALVRNHTWSLVAPTIDMIILSSKWDFRTKYKANGSLDKFKARLVAKGFQQAPGLD
ncbi:uncharacterized mitochondrial protein AtMg00820-like [Humulus lupulus]|uniref:uncharacterized mitochondrial protein AtMg00820-like n=1 Tax=Humulus lupulus TaxID=3486 RepID=UPI002B4047B5|nr:uncharacterized mitochondrial protein AtMg00820-like [Humulus lupulus]